MRFLPFLITLALSIGAVEAQSSKDYVDSITDSVVNLCNKPAEAGSYWEVRVKGDGEASIKLKLAKLGMTDAATFSKSEWQGVKGTVEDAADYQDCVTALTPTFMEKFSKLAPAAHSDTKSRRILAGVSWEETGLGVSLTLKTCNKKATSITCGFVANATESDVVFYLDPSSVIFDQDGNKFDSSFGAIANESGPLVSVGVRAELVKGVDTNLKIRFDNVRRTSNIISKASLVTYIKGGGVNDSNVFDFRKVELALE